MVPLSSVVALITDQLPVTTVKVKLNVVFNVKYGYLYYNYCSMTRHIKVNTYTVFATLHGKNNCHRVDAELYNYFFSFSQT